MDIFGGIKPEHGLIGGLIVGLGGVFHFDRRVSKLEKGSISKELCVKCGQNTHEKFDALDRRIDRLEDNLGGKLDKIMANLLQNN